MANLRPWKPIWESELFGDWGRDLENMSQRWSRMLGNLPSTETAKQPFWPATDITENPEGWRLAVDIPGVDRDKVQISLKDNILRIKGERVQDSRAEGENWVRTERSFGSFERDFTLPSGVEEEKITANFRNGTLEVFIPRAPEEKLQGRSIPIND